MLSGVDDGSPEMSVESRLNSRSLNEPLPSDLRLLHEQA